MRREVSKKKDIPDHNMSCPFYKMMIERRGAGRNPGLRGAQGDLEAELCRNSREEPACSDGQAAQPMRR